MFKERRLKRHIDMPKSFFLAEKLKAYYSFEYDFPFHYHDWYELYYLIDGSCVHRIEKKEYVLSPGDWIIVPCNMDHKVKYNTDTHERVLFAFSKDYIPATLLGKTNLLFANPMFVPDEGERTVMADIAQKLLSEYQNPDVYSEEIIRNLIFELLVYFIRKPSDAEFGQIKDLMTEHTIDYIMGHYSKNITLEELADINYVSVGYLSRKFKKDTGLNVSDYIRKVRINKAKKLLSETNDSISEISVKCGYNDSNYFSYVFKKEEKISPSKFRKQYS